ncbi:MAG: hypothetical protein RIC56_09230 [Pseudomonadales bacterium]
MAGELPHAFGDHLDQIVGKIEILPAQVVKDVGDGFRSAIHDGEHTAVAELDLTLDVEDMDFTAIQSPRVAKAHEQAVGIVLGFEPPFRPLRLLAGVAAPPLAATPLAAAEPTAEELLERLDQLNCMRNCRLPGDHANG